ncbi:MAG TPA: ABC transporter permease [Thermodesulfobacteriota bacterium]|nr:ABC transporter permease [Thermodesulfobacteriota bacterium]
MNGKRIFIAYLTIIRKELVRIFRIWSQTLLPSVITISLYYVIFGSFIGSRIGDIGGFSYIQFIVPGLVMMAVITNSFSNVISSFFSAKFQRNLEELLISPTPEWIIIAGYVTGGVVRGLIVGALVLFISLLFTHVAIHSPTMVVLFITFTAVLFSLAGLLNAIFAKSFDGISIVPTFVLTPLTYLGGVFYSINVLPPFWQNVSLANPILYMVNGFRYGFLGVTDVSIFASFGILFVLTLILLCINLYVFKIGYGLRN